MNFTHEFWIQIMVYVVGGIVFIAVNAYKVGLLESRLATKVELKEKENTRNLMIDRVYQRFDEHKKECSDSYVRRDMCGQLHLTTKDDIKKLDDDAKNFRHEIRAALMTLQLSFDNFKVDVLERLPKK